MRIWNKLTLCAGLLAALVGSALFSSRTYSGEKEQWEYKSPEHGFTIQVPSKKWKQGKQPGAAVAFHNPAPFGIAGVHVAKEDKDDFQRVSVRAMKAVLEQYRSDLLSKPYFKEGQTPAGNRYAYWKVKAKAEKGGTVFCAHSVVWCKDTGLTVKVLLEGTLKMTSKEGIAAEWDYFERAADLMCLSPR